MGGTTQEPSAEVYSFARRFRLFFRKKPAWRSVTQLPYSRWNTLRPLVGCCSVWCRSPFRHVHRRTQCFYDVSYRRWRSDRTRCADTRFSSRQRRRNLFGTAAYRIAGGAFVGAVKAAGASTSPLSARCFCNGPDRCKVLYTSVTGQDALWSDVSCNTSWQHWNIQSLSSREMKGRLQIT
jgi:hypothetical protein